VKESSKGRADYKFRIQNMDLYLSSASLSFSVPSHHMRRVWSGVLLNGDGPLARMLI
jgi:hypothetical protein